MRERIFRQRRVREGPGRKGILERVAIYQQTAFLVAGLMYALGYLPRAINAWDNNLGALPGVRFDYLVAGALLLIPPVALCLAIWGVWLSAKRLAASAADDPQRKTRIQNLLTGGMLLGMGMVIFFPDRVKTVGSFLMVVSFLYLLIYLYAADKFSSTSETPTESGKLPSTSETPTESGKLTPTSKTPKSSSVGRWQKVLNGVGKAAAWAWTGLTAAWVGLLLILVFAFVVLFGVFAIKYVPQELGGISPKCGLLDLSPEQLSSEVRSLIVDPGDPIDPSAKVIRSKPLEVFSTSDPWLIRVPNPKGVGPARSLRLDGKAVLSVEWCR
ncbi:MAG TPA: hypothetical protein VFX97_19385 [Pyrinomonadaceae bacterium]|nr:hypothetical protein [Pyrinomonadaceae bacterium]